MSRVAACILAVGLNIALYIAAVPVAEADSGTISLYASLSPRTFKNPVASVGSGHAEFTLDRSNFTLNWFVAFQSLTSQPTSVTIRRPGSGRDEVQIEMARDQRESPLMGAARLDADQIAELLSGFLYVTITTRAFAEGELRGQIKRMPTSLKD